MFLMPGLICVIYLTKVPFPDANKEAMRFYLKNHQQTDGGWGTHIECASTMFGTVLSYVALRLLGEDPSSECMKAGRQFILQHGGALYAPRYFYFYFYFYFYSNMNHPNSMFTQYCLTSFLSLFFYSFFPNNFVVGLNSGWQ
jgi:hypothetical protein